MGLKWKFLDIYFRVKVEIEVAILLYIFIPNTTCSKNRSLKGKWDEMKLASIWSWRLALILSCCHWFSSHVANSMLKIFQRPFTSTSHIAGVEQTPRRATSWYAELTKDTSTPSRDKNAVFVVSSPSFTYQAKEMVK